MSVLEIICSGRGGEVTTMTANSAWWCEVFNVLTVQWNQKKPGKQDIMNYFNDWINWKIDFYHGLAGYLMVGAGALNYCIAEATVGRGELYLSTLGWFERKWCRGQSYNSLTQRYVHSAGYTVWQYFTEVWGHIYHGHAWDHINISHSYSRRSRFILWNGHIIWVHSMRRADSGSGWNCFRGIC